MEHNDYALVAYLPGQLGSFIGRLRCRYNPRLAAWLPHVTILPPRSLNEPLEEPLQVIRHQCALVEPFEATICKVATFWPRSGVVYLAFSEVSKRLVRLHDDLNTGPLAGQEAHPYVPHVTIAQDLDEASTLEVLADVKREWSQHDHVASFLVESLLLVQYTLENRWRDVAAIPLGERVALPQR